jgi:alginate O-acetyltransferase complex protein AlgI
MLTSFGSRSIELGRSLVSFEFLIFLAAVFIVYYTIARRWQWQFLLVASYLFYAFNNRWEYVFLLALVTGINFLSGILIQNSFQRSIRRFYLALSIGLNTVILLVFKYGHVWWSHLRSSGVVASVPGLALAVPLGISYFSFKAISYGVDVYREKIKSENNLGRFALYLSFFPEILAGPIDRAKELLPQICVPKLLVETDVVSGLRLMLWGFFKKIVIADNLALYVNQIYGAPREYSGIPLTIVTYFLAFQIYSDFSGYTDIVRGAGRLLGYHMPENFNSPYLSKSISEFWTRWHITLSTWLRDYLFLPLSFFFSRRIKSSSVLFLNSNVLIYFSSALITFMLAGIWHGSAWTFIVWGTLHGLYLSLSNMTRHVRKTLRKKFPLHRKYPKLVALGQTIFCFHLVAFSWIFFRASSMSDALYIIKNILPTNVASFAGVFMSPIGQLELGSSKYGFILSGLALLFLIVMEIRQKGREMPMFLVSHNPILRWAAYYILLLSIFLFGEFGLKEFIYIQF